MKRKLIKSLLLIVCLLCSITADAYDFESGGIYYNITKSGNSVEVTSNNLNSIYYSGEVNIPETVEYNDVTYQVTSIGISAFYDCVGLTKVTIPNSVTLIGNSAFLSCF